MDKLKPCPFCGRNHGLLVASTRQYIDGVLIEQWSVFCDASGDKVGCGAMCGYHDSKEKAIEAWNRRAYASETEAQLQASRRVVEWLMQEE